MMVGKFSSHAFFFWKQIPVGCDVRVQFDSLRLMKQWPILLCSSSGSQARDLCSGVSVETCSAGLSSEPEISY